MNRVLAATVWAMLLPQLAQAQDLVLEQGTWELGGTGTVDMYFGNGASDVTLTLAPAAGYFLADNLELRGGVDLRFSDGFNSWSFFAGIDYFPPGGSVQPYVGGTLGFGEYNFGGFFSDEVLIVTGRGGILIPMNRRVGIDLGGRLEIIAADEVLLHVPLGYFGVRAFF